MPAQPKVTKRSLPHHSVPRLSSACPHSGPVPRAAATGHPWPGAAKSASLPIYPLHRAYLRPSWLTGPADQNQKQIKIKSTQPRWRSTAATGWRCFSVGAGLPAMQTPRWIRYAQSMLSQASQLPHLTVPDSDLAVAVASPHSSRPVGRCALAFDLDLRRPVKPRWPNAGFGAWVTRQDAGLAVLGQGWPMTAAHGPKPE